MNKDKILIIGANGQIGTALLPKLQKIYGEGQVIASDLQPAIHPTAVFEILDAKQSDTLQKVIKKHGITQIYHLAAVLSAKGESNPLSSWNINMQTLLNVLEAAKELHLKKVFVPSSIAVFGKSAPRRFTPQNTYLDPATVYGMSKVAAENWCQYYHSRYQVDVRSLRYPGVISYQSIPGGGTTDYAVEMYHKAVAGQNYDCYLQEDARLPMMYIEDALRATTELMEAPAGQLSVRTSYNLTGISFTPAELFKNIQEQVPAFDCTFTPDFRQSIAESWPESIDDTLARKDWNWKPDFDLAQITTEMIAHLTRQYISHANH
ncbi:NAD-dependent epimerase/dehydratase family protein [Mucilaginibacter arboris]|uniref:NAD-dependent epimerase/dehydratase family protein n=1 Tax=Mucilaginibacter arboris TaxID=2682090 RepID=A0A7K1T0M5_9SPHI|nr:NAD-dependent epimerase/dehydratase family protein [Mucilaginibacter arboris]MVN23088.1 NAD-dependent epimerase/dehydratase family protein [Mucilaginibacter arboris]